MWAKKAVQSKHFEDTKEKKWQGKLRTARWEDEKLDGECFSWMTEWRAAPKHTIAGIMEHRRVAEVFRKVFVLTGIFIKRGY